MTAVAHKGIIPSFAAFLEKLDTSTSKLEQLDINIIIMPYKEEDGKLNCYHRIENKKKITCDGYFSDMETIESISDTVLKIIRLCKDHGENAFFKIIFKAQAESACLMEGKPTRRICSFAQSCEGPPDGEFRFDCLGTIPPQFRTSLLLESLDLADIPQSSAPMSKDEQKKFLLMP